jgi:hypothetical protein
MNLSLRRFKGTVNNTIPVNNIKQLEFLKILGITFQSNCRFSEHIRLKLFEANKCLFVIRSLRKEGYNQTEIDHLFQTIVLSKIRYGLSVYGASMPELTVVQHFLKRCHKRRYISYPLNIYTLLEKSDRTIFKKISNQSNHPLFNLMPTIKESSLRLRNKSSQLPSINTERFKNSFLNRLIFKYKLVIN